MRKDIEVDLKVLGAGCANCHALADRTTEALGRLGREGTVEHVTDYSVIASYGVMNTPALVADGKVVVAGRVPEIEEIQELLKATV